MTEQATELVLRKSVRVARTREDAFRLYTEGMATWWPLATHSVAEENAETVTFDPGIGGLILEHAKDGTKHHWGTVTVWAPPERLVLTWHPGRDASTGQTVELHFRPDGDGTLVELIHTGWEALGPEARTLFENYDGGWDYVFGERFGRAGR
jgi:uncharacterized protein YndB with AHSA1/START domain